MKPTSYIINCTARGAIIDETALHFALKENLIKGAGLDMLEDGPTKRSPLFDLPNVILTPHVGHVSDTSYNEMEQRVCKEVVSFFQGEWPPIVVNPKVKDKPHFQNMKP
jgi:phosphoglycerate dehydrogenase-like enzyme